jgi:8-oxo-dGTP diphosphatase
MATIGAERAEAALPTPLLLVVACALVDPDGRVLIAQRPEGKPMAGLWEFPGGKVEPGETPEATLVRELREELGIDVSASCLAPLSFASHAYEEFHLLMPLYVCRRWNGTPEPREVAALKWVRPNRLRDYPMPPADVPLVAALTDLL